MAHYNTLKDFIPSDLDDDMLEDFYEGNFYDSDGERKCADVESEDENKDRTHEMVNSGRGDPCKEIPEDGYESPQPSPPPPPLPPTPPPTPPPQA